MITKSMPISKLWAGRVTPYKGGSFFLLQGYFDDSGTHRGSDIVVWAGFLATEERWTAFEKDWRDLLETYGISAFHIYDCTHGTGDFDGWCQGKRDAAIYDFREIILTHNLLGIGCAASVKDWDDLVIGEHRKYLRTSEEYCLSRVVSEAVRFEVENYPDNRMAIMFDQRDRPDTEIIAINRIFDFYGKRHPRLTEYSFVRTKSVLPVQAADMFAWESYQYAKEYLKTGQCPEARPHFKHFLDKGLLHGKILHRCGIEQLLKSYDHRTD